MSEVMVRACHLKRERRDGGGIERWWRISGERWRHIWEEKASGSGEDKKSKLKIKPYETVCWLSRNAAAAVEDGILISNVVTRFVAVTDIL